MGSKFCNLNIHGADLAAIESLCPNHIVRSISQSWITVAGESLEWGATQKEAKRLSKVLPHHVLSTEYFDDDYVEFTIYCNGKRVARHVPAEYESFARSPGKSKVWAEQLGLSQEAEKDLRIVFKETSPETSLRLIECVLNCPLWVDADSINSTLAPAQEYLTEYLERKNAEKKIKNQTKLVLLDEVNGDFGWNITYPVVRDEHKDAVKSFWNIQYSTLRKLFEKSIPERLRDTFAQDRGEGAFLLTFEQMSTRKSEEIAYVFSDGGEVLDTFHKDKSMLLHGAFLDRDRVFLEGNCWNIRTHKKEWDIGIEQTAYGICAPCRLKNGRLAIVYDTMGTPLNSYLASFQPDGSEKIVLELPQYRHWSYPVAYNNDFVLGCGNFLTCYDSFLEKLWSVDLGENVGQLGKPFLDIETKTLYMSTYRRVTAFDLEKQQIKAIRDIADGEDCYLHDVLPGVGPIMLTGDSSIQVWNSELTPISRHRAKGAIGKIIHQDGKVYVLTNASEDRTLKKTDNGWESIIIQPGCLRLYELKM